MTPRRAFDFARALWRAYGVRGSLARAWHEIRKAIGFYRKAPRPVSSRAERSRVPVRWPFVVDVERVKSSTRHAEAMARAERVRGGEHQAYRWTWRPLPKTPVEWRTHPDTGFEHEIEHAWFAVAHYDRRAGDVKDVWEPARFAWAYDLVRGWMLTGDDSFARAFWEFTEAFLDGNPPFMGLQWSCGQETSIRAVAWLWAEANLANAPSSTPERMARLRRALVWSAERVEDAIGYAVIQRNNHGISEAAGLAVLGARFLDDEPRAKGWMESGNRLLDAQVLDQFLDDGWYLQHSFNYARLALDQIVIAQRALQSRGLGLSAASCARIRAAVGLLADVADEQTGRLPIHGPNDGAYVLPLSTADYQDFRPTLTGAAVTCGSGLPANVAPDREVLAWLGAKAPVSPARRSTAFARSGTSGWALARVGDVVFFARAGRYVSRPAHIDPLHVDLWARARPVAIDAGTYRYWADPPWVNGLAIADVHNTITIEGLPLAKRGPRYLWIRWPSARVESAEATQSAARVTLVNESWLERHVEHRRICDITEHTVTVIDELRAPASFRARVTAQWLLDVDPGIVSITASSPLERTIVHGEPHSVMGWQSQGYGERRPVVSLRGTAPLQNGLVRIVSTFDLAALRAANGAAESRQMNLTATVS